MMLHICTKFYEISQRVFELLPGHEIVTDGQTDGRTDRQTDFVWRGPNQELLMINLSAMENSENCIR